MQINVTVEELAAAFARDWPLQYEITTLRLIAEAQGQRIAELESAAVQPEEEPQ